MNLARYPYSEEQMFPYIPVGQPTPYMGSFNTPMIIETPETILARTNPKGTLKLLEQISIERYHSRLNEIGSSVMNTYLNRLTSEDASGLKECEFQEIERRNIFGIVTERGMKFVFRR